MTSTPEQQHTPGPWRAAIDPGHIVVLNDAFGNVCIMQSRRNWVDIETEAAANARLIASAPDLLEACQYGLLKAACATGDKMGLNSAEFLTFCEKARAAIAKAKGEPQ